MTDMAHGLMDIAEAHEYAHHATVAGRAARRVLEQKRVIDDLLTRLDTEAREARRRGTDKDGKWRDAYYCGQYDTAMKLGNHLLVVGDR